MRNACSINAKYSTTFENLASALVANPELTKLEIDDDEISMTNFIDGVESSVSPWPIVIDQHRVSELQLIAKLLPNILSKAFNYYSKKSLKDTCEYLNINDFGLEEIKSRKVRLEDIIWRFDAVYSQGEIKIIEANTGSSLGGWWADLYFKKISRFLSEIPISKDWNLSHRNICRGIVAHVLGAIYRLKGPSAQGNVVIYMPDIKVDGKKTLETHFSSLLKDSYFKTPSVTFVGDLDELEWAEDNVYLGDKEIDSILLFTLKGDEVTVKLRSKIKSYALKEKIYYPDDFMNVFFANKLLFGLLHKEDVKLSLSSQEVEFIEKYIPRTYALSEDVFSVSGARIDAQSYVIENKENLVIKKSNSMQGKDVFIGKAMSIDEWREIYQKYRTDRDWLVQEYNVPDEVTSASKFSGLDKFEVVWGIFSFGGEYGGGSCRAIPASREDKVINLSSGAFEFVIAEEKYNKRRLVL